MDRDRCEVAASCATKIRFQNETKVREKKRGPGFHHPPSSFGVAMTDGHNSQQREERERRGKRSFFEMQREDEEERREGG